MGWFGPRGLASVVFTLIAVEDLTGSAVDMPLLEVATWTILLSVLLHGLTARPLSAAYGARITAGRDDQPELVDDARAPRAAPSATGKRRRTELTWTLM